MRCVYLQIAIIRNQPSVAPLPARDDDDDDENQSQLFLILAYTTSEARQATATVYVYGQLFLTIEQANHITFPQMRAALVLCKSLASQ